MYRELLKLRNHLWVWWPPAIREGVWAPQVMPASSRIITLFTKESHIHASEHTHTGSLAQLITTSHALLLQDAEENLGETEVRDALHAKATFLGKIGDREAAAKAFKDTEDKTASGGSKADMVFSRIRCAARNRG